jgi:hypothetical protein
MHILKQVLTEPFFLSHLLSYPYTKSHNNRPGKYPLPYVEQWSYVEDMTTWQYMAYSRHYDCNTIWLKHVDMICNSEVTHNYAPIHTHAHTHIFVRKMLVFLFAITMQHNFSNKQRAMHTWLTCGKFSYGGIHSYHNSCQQVTLTFPYDWHLLIALLSDIT